jgi:hypothetical protein
MSHPCLPTMCETSVYHLTGKDWSLSSPPFCRAFQESLGPQFQEANPQLEYLVQQRPSRHPFLEAKYREITPPPCQ